MFDPDRPISSYSRQELLEIKFHVFNILAENPWLSRLYQGYFKLCRRNPTLLNILGDRSAFFIGPDLYAANIKLAKQNEKAAEKAKLKTERRKAKREARKLKAANPQAASRKGKTMPRGINQKKSRVKELLNQKTSPKTGAKVPRCCLHVKVNGIRCASPALRGHVFCYFHQRLIRGVATPPLSRLHPIAFLEDETSIQASLMEVVNALVRNTIDYRRAQLVLRALHIAVKNSPRVQFHADKNKMVAKVPEFPAAPPQPKEVQPPAEEPWAGMIYKPMPPDPVAIANASILAALPVHTNTQPTPGPLQPIPAHVFAEDFSGFEVKHKSA